ncbi:MAG: hypothetical protein K1X35_02190 [Caulobacteraceae bacterium]|nr:hypothetical protein [Caulobacteraceae bacterium]
MDGQVITAVLAGPLLLLGLYELFGVRRLFSADSAKVFVWGLLFALVAFPLLVFFGAVDVEPGRDILIELAGRMVRIWLSIFGLAVAGRWGIAICRWLWARRPRPNRYDPNAKSDTRV